MKYYYSWVGMWVTLMVLNMAGAIEMKYDGNMGFMLLISWILGLYLYYKELSDDNSFYTEVDDHVAKVQALCQSQQLLIAKQCKDMGEALTLLQEYSKTNTNLINLNKETLKDLDELMERLRHEKESNAGYDSVRRA